METEEKQINCAVSNHINPIHKNITMEELEHIAACDICAKEYAKLIEEQAMIKAPHYLKDNILEKTRVLSKVQEKNKQILYKRPWKKLQLKKFQLLTFSMKIGLAMCGALVLLFFTPGENVSLGEPQRMESLMIKINHELNEFSNNITDYTDELALANKKINREEFRYDKKEK